MSEQFPLYKIQDKTHWYRQSQGSCLCGAGEETRKGLGKEKKPSFLDLSAGYLWEIHFENSSGYTFITCALGCMFDFQKKLPKESTKLFVAAP